MLSLMSEMSAMSESMRSMMRSISLRLLLFIVCLLLVVAGAGLPQPAG